ncbi:SigB/SigF/SigG family RNA polymerase sigma factor [Streptomyces sp. NPDC048362]|uniref:SigB/SigF/SigG family RNA polymerase sigma factor n=1 Tax=Streptomyces sp. NPDC048362 TaxID=3365539 RepID=UPI00371412FE
MLADLSNHHLAAPASTSPAPRRRDHMDSPDTAALFARFISLTEGAEREAVREDLVTAWLPMAHRIAGRFRDRGEATEDLRQVAAIGLIKAINRFDPTRGAFESYAVPTITGEIKRHFRDCMWAMRVPRRVQDLRNKVRRARLELMQAPGSREPTIADIAAHTQLSEDDVFAGLEALDSFSTLSLDVDISTGDDSPTVADTLAAADTSYDVVIDREAAKEGLRRLPERERAILYMRFFQDMTQNRIAEHFGISQMHVSRIINRSCARIRNEALDDTSSSDLVQ